MSARITYAGNLASSVLKTGAGTVTTIFDRSIYLEAESNKEAIVCLGTSALVEGPINIITSYNHLPDIEPGSPWVLDSHKLKIDKHEVLLGDNYAHTNTTTYYNRSSKPDATIIALLENEVPQQQLINSVAYQTEKQLQSCLATIDTWLNHDSPGIPPALTRILGCGEGLTPSGDDILIGVLITLHHSGNWGKFNALSKWIRNLASDHTNRISTAHLNAATEGLAVAPLHNLINALFDNDPDATAKAILELHRYGHRSGLDALRGVLSVARRLPGGS